MFFQGRLIIGYIQEPRYNQYIFQLAEGEECLISREEFMAHWQAYCQFERHRAEQHSDHYHPLPITSQIRQKLNLFPVDVSQRHNALKVPLRA